MKSRPHIIIVGQLPPPIHGQSVVIERISKLDLRGYELSVIPLNCSSEIESVGRFQFKKVFAVARAALTLCRTVRQGDRDALVYYPPASPDTVPVLRDFIFFVIARSTVRKWLFHFHAGGLPEFLQGTALGRSARWIYPEPKVNLSLSQESAPTPGDFFGGEDVYLPLGLEVPIEFEDRGHLAERRLLFVGNLFISKGVAMCVRAVAELRSLGYPVVLDLVGGHTSHDRESIVQLVEELCVGDHVRFHGVLSGEPKWATFRSAECFVFPSYYPSEKFPNVLIEALGAGLPVITSRWRGIPELMGDCSCGNALIEPKDQVGFERAIRAVLDAEEDEYKSYRRESRKRYEERFTLDQFGSGMLDAFNAAYNSLTNR